MVYLISIRQLNPFVVFLGEVTLRLSELKLDSSNNWYKLKDRPSRKNKFTITGELMVSFEQGSNQLLVETDNGNGLLSLSSQLPKVLRNIFSIIYCITPILEAVSYIASLLQWKNPTASLLAFLFYIYIVHHDYVFAFLLISLFVYISSGYFHQAFSTSPKRHFVHPNHLSVKQLEFHARSTIDRYVTYCSYIYIYIIASFFNISIQNKI